MLDATKVKVIVQKTKREKHWRNSSIPNSDDVFVELFRPQNNLFIARQMFRALRNSLGIHASLKSSNFCSCIFKGTTHLINIKSWSPLFGWPNITQRVDTTFLSIQQHGEMNGNGVLTVCDVIGNLTWIQKHALLICSKLPGARTCRTSWSQSHGARSGDMAERRVLESEVGSSAQSRRTERKESSSLNWEKARQGSEPVILVFRWIRVRLDSDIRSLQFLVSNGSRKCCFRSLTSLARGSSRRLAWYRPCTNSAPVPSSSKLTTRQVSVEPFLEPSLSVNTTASFHFPIIIFDNFCCCLTWCQNQHRWEMLFKKDFTISILSAGRILIESSWASPSEGLVTRAREEARQRLPAVHLQS